MSLPSMLCRCLWNHAAVAVVMVGVGGVSTAKFEKEAFINKWKKSIFLRNVTCRCLFVRFKMKLFLIHSAHQSANTFKGFKAELPPAPLQTSSCV